MQVLEYKGIIFDDFVRDKNGHYWAEICHKCAEKYGDLIQDEIDDGGTARGCCSVKGCYNDGAGDEIMHYYIDFKEEFIKFNEISEDEIYDDQYI